MFEWFICDIHIYLVYHIMYDIDKVVFITFRKGLGSGTENTSAYALQMQYGELGSRFLTTSERFIYTGKMYQC